VLFVAFFDLVELVFTGLILVEGDWIEEVAVLLVFVDDVEGHFEVGVLELDDEVDKNLVFHLRDGKVLPTFPEFFSHPVGYNSHIFQVLDVPLDIVDFLREQSR